LFALTDAYPEAIRTRDRRARTPLHFALSNAGRKTVPAAVRLLLNLDPSVVNSVESGPLPLRVLADYAQQLRSSDTENRDEKRDSVLRCLEHLLNAEPEPTADFFTALQSLPEWLGERAVVMAVVQNLLNEKISQRFPTAVLLLDFVVCTYTPLSCFVFCCCLFPKCCRELPVSPAMNHYFLAVAVVIAFYSLSVVKSINRRFDDDDGNDAISVWLLLPLYLGAGYFALREIVQIISLLSLRVFKLWVCLCFPPRQGHVLGCLRFSSLRYV
jgi:hypothetical protein